MTDQHTSLGLSRVRAGGSTSYKCGSTSSLSRTHAPFGPPKAGERRSKVPLRAKKIVCAMDRGFEKAREKEARNDAAVELKKARIEREEEDSMGDVAAGKETSSTASLSTPASPNRCDSSVGDETAIHGPIRTSKCSDAWTRSKRSRPKQVYLTSIKSTQSPSSGEEEDSTSIASSSSTSSSLVHKVYSIPRVPLFSSASKREIQSLTSRKALQDEKNPITHSTVGAGTLHYNSSSTGHQQANRVGASNASAPEGWWHTRMRKLKDQAGSEERQSDLFGGLSVYINGYAGIKIGNKELQRLLSLNGAEVHYLPNGKTTHIVSEMPLSAKKTQEMLQLKAGRVKRFVKVDWILDSLEAGKRRPEHPYAHPIVVQRGIAQMLNSHSSGKATTPGVPSPGKASLGSSTQKDVKSSIDDKADLAKQDWRGAARNAAALAAATTTDRQKRCS